MSLSHIQLCPTYRKRVRERYPWPPLVVVLKGVCRSYALKSELSQSLVGAMGPPHSRGEDWG